MSSKKYSENAKKIRENYRELLNRQVAQDLDLILEKEEYLEGFIELANYENDKKLKKICINCIGLIGNNAFNNKNRENAIQSLIDLLKNENMHEFRNSIFNALFYVLRYYISKKNFTELKKINATKFYKQAIKEAEYNSEIVNMLTSLGAQNLENFLQELKLELPSGFEIKVDKTKEIYPRYYIQTKIKTDLRRPVD